MAGNSNQQEAVGGVLNNPNAALKERFRALFTLKNLGGEEAIKQISRCFTDPSALLKHECAYCLGQMQDELAIPFLTQVLKDTAQEAMVRHEAGTWSSHSWHWGQSTCACSGGGGGYSLYDGWYIRAAVLTPFFDPLGTKLDLFGVFFLIHQHKNDLLGTNPRKIRSFWPQNTIFPSIFWGPIFSGPRHTPSNLRTEYEYV